jgi:ribosomal protein S18 acetylase RimI-like enzyme
MSRSGVEIRAAGPDDARALAALWLESAAAHVALDPLFYVVPDLEAAMRRAERTLLDEATVVLLAVLDTRIVAACELRRLPRPTPGGMVRDIAAVDVGIVVSADHRRQGIGRALMEAAEARAVDDGFELMTLNARSDNAEAIGLYGSLGYEDVGVVMSRWIRSDG